MAMKGRMIINFIELWSIAGSGGLDIWVSVISLWKSNICRPQQPPTERYQISVKNWNFDDPFHKKGLVLVIWVPGMIQLSGSVNALMNWGCRGHWGHWGHWGCWGHWHCRGSKAGKINTEVIQVLEFWCFENKIIFVWIMKYHVSFTSFSVRGCWG